ncbi:16S rRNA (cytidine(1402)-2'-O)-methyltransferase [Campylobacter sp. MIT 21-1685]|uniref:16S rRNA (cytidine(1402)-2'-O)-methyltransferase n=1 Tax=unclassified Campylobacter TaxID=2593542 RepID=UPI00224B160E|nr:MULTISPECIES: 16S rRNA (cytidine(1402)-2'-O)-methyltransferase [unclassified Campylobacter]MCX2682721.1 16S rRNA (cytidine(1402)-2'-O)-methyltransferase [Campylobacter sp. MIT 21-1684]MCX2751003.1 16S rRNA (cytidine(1402)-2'-O)-methyltransferase [Campylobacter sp. MIT 21-1682]MCX2807066.1 16S rRNA (cytidine(1402)-2'-O)-methyltransferase [Campylobacter sp. MIT 21-1685]
MLYFIPTPIGNLKDISIRALELFETCEIFFCEDTRVSKALFAKLCKKFNICFDSKTFISFHSHNEKQVLQNLDLKIFEKNIAFISDAGMPGISDPGKALVEFALQNALEFEVLAGANAALVALVSSGFCEKEFIFMGFLANKGKQRQKDIEKVLSNIYPSILYESPKRILSLVKDFAQKEPERQLFVIKEISKKFENKFYGKSKEVLIQLQEANLNGEWVLVVQAATMQQKHNMLCEADILELELPLKIKSKLLAKMNGKNPKELYAKLLLSQNKVQ